MSFALRAATGQDAAAAAAIERLAGHGRWDEAAFAAELEAPRSRFWVATAPGGEVIGFAVTWQVADELQLQDLATHPAWQRRGVARALLERVIDEARAVRAAHVDLEVRRGNDAARALYAARGFVEVGARRGYYADTGEDAVLMRLVI